MEELLNKLIEKGWKPFGMGNYDRFIIEHTGDMCFRWKYPGADGESAFDYNYDYFKIRELVSIDSGLWQFVCDREHRLINKRNYGGVSLDKRLKNPYVDYDGVNTEYEWITGLDYQYRLIESALKDESELEDFLLSNIKVGNED